MAGSPVAIDSSHEYFLIIMPISIVVVEPPVTRRLPHSSGRSELLHPAPQSFNKRCVLCGVLAELNCWTKPLRGEIPAAAWLNIKCNLTPSHRGIIQRRIMRLQAYGIIILSKLIDVVVGVVQLTLLKRQNRGTLNHATINIYGLSNGLILLPTITASEHSR